MPGKHLSLAVLSWLLCTTLAGGAGCKLDSQYFAGFGAGYLLGQLSGPPFVAVVRERVCYQGGEQITCPPEEAAP